MRRRGWQRGPLATAAILLVPAVLSAQMPPRGKPTRSEQPGEEAAHLKPPSTEPGRPEPHQEWGILPALGNSPDTGFRIGVFTHVVQLDPNVHPYRWRARAMIQTSILVNDRIEFPLQEHFLLLDLPQFPDDSSRLRLDLTWKKQLNAGYFGLGNASQPGDLGADPDNFHEYRVETVSGSATVDRALGTREWRALLGLGLERNDIDTYAGSLLARDVATARTDGRRIPGVSAFTELTLQGGLVLDTRDHETFATRGVFHDLVARVAPSIAGGPEWASITYTARYYLSIVSDRLVLAMRVLGDVLAGDAPLMKLASYGGLLGEEAVGGAHGVRGIVGGRFVGKTKALGNAELRSQLVPFELFGNPMNLGAAAFFDSGRVWVGSLAPDLERDGTGLGLHWGAGGGPRLRWGDSLMIQLDIAHSPNSTDFGGGAVAVYLSADSKF